MMHRFMIFLSPCCIFYFLYSLVFEIQDPLRKPAPAMPVENIHLQTVWFHIK